MEKDNFKDLILKGVEKCEEIIIGLAEDHFTDDRDKIDFVMSAAINFLGNLSVGNSHDNLESIKRNAAKTIGALGNWFQTIIIELEESQRNTKQ